MADTRIVKLLAVAILLAASLATVHGTAAAHGPPAANPQTTEQSDCWVRNTSTGVVGPDLQVAIDDASSGDRLRVRGTCYGSFYFQRAITLHGPATLSGKACYEGECFAAGTTVQVTDANVKLKNLVITDGYATHIGGGIYNSGGNVTLSNTDVRGNWAEDGGGGIVNEGGTVRLNRHSSVTDSWLLDDYLFRGSGGVLNHGTLILNGFSRVEGNTNGGIHSDGRVILNRRATVTGNSGGGLRNEGGKVWFSPRWRGTLCGNTPDDWPTC